VDKVSVRKRRRKRRTMIRVLAPEYFENRDIGFIMVSSPDKLVNKTLEVPLILLTNFPLHNYMACKLKIIEVEDNNAYTIYYGHRYFREYIQALFMKGTSYVDIYRDIEVKEGVRYRILAGVYTRRNISTSRKRAIRRAAFKILDKYNNVENLKFLKSALYGVIDAEIGAVSRKIYPIRWVGIQKIKVVG
jgi:ribosomal protein S3AE